MCMCVQVNLWTKHLIFKQNLLLAANSNLTSEKCAVGQEKKTEIKVEQKGANEEERDGRRKENEQIRYKKNADGTGRIPSDTSFIRVQFETEDNQDKQVDVPEYMDNPSLPSLPPPPPQPVSGSVSAASLRRSISRGASASNLISLSSMHVVGVCRPSPDADPLVVVLYLF